MNIKEIRELVNEWYKPYSDKPEALLVFNAILDHIAALSERVDLYWTQHGVKLQTLAERVEKLETRANTASSSSSNYNNRLQDFERRLRAIEKNSPVIAPFTWTLESVDAFNKMKPEQNPPIIHDDSCRCKRCAERCPEPPEFEGYEWTGEFRLAKKGEYWVDPKWWNFVDDKYPSEASRDHGYEDFVKSTPSYIYRKVEPKKTELCDRCKNRFAVCQTSKGPFIIVSGKFCPECSAKLTDCKVDPDPRALDVEVAKALGKELVVRPYSCPKAEHTLSIFETRNVWPLPQHRYMPIPHYSTDDTAAIKALEEYCRKNYVTSSLLYLNNFDEWLCGIAKTSDEARKSYSKRCNLSFALAICHAIVEHGKKGGK